MNVSLEADLANNPPTGSRSETLPAVLPAAIALLVVISAVAGVHSYGASLIRPDAATLASFGGQDVVNLLVGLALLAGSVNLVRRRSLPWLLLWTGALFHLAYSHAFYVLGSRFTSLLPIYVAVVSMSLFALLELLFDVDADALKSAFGRRAPARTVAGYLALTAVLLVSTHDADVAASSASRLVGSLDLLTGATALIGTAALLSRQRPWGFMLATLLLPKAVLFGLARGTSMTLAAVDGGTFDPLPTVGYFALGAVGVVVTARYLRSIDRSASTIPLLRS